MEIRQLRYFIALAEELHFGKAAAREHIVQSALSQQVQRLERELGVLLLERTTHSVELTMAGSAFLVEARAVLAQVDRAALIAQRACAAPGLRVGIIDASHDSMPRILSELEQRRPLIEVHETETGVPEQLRLLLDGRLDVGIGRASIAPPEVASELVRLDTLGVVVPEVHRFAGWPAVPVAALAEEPLLMAERRRAPDFCEFVNEVCRSVGFVPTLYRGTVDSIRAAITRVLRGRCVVCTPASCVRPLSGTVWKPLVEPVSRYPWSVLWRATDDSEPVRDLVVCARSVSRELGWLTPAI
jgi:DNA-binding transcriptional LysR family regulator